MNGLEDQFDNTVEVVSLNAADSAEGQVAYEQLILPGHPSIVIFDADQQEIYRGFGTFDADELEAQLQSLLTP